MAAALSHVLRDQWPDDVLTYQREQQRLKTRKDREMQIEDDRLRREVEQQRRQESSSPKSLPTNQKNNIATHDFARYKSSELQAATSIGSRRRERRASGPDDRRRNRSCSHGTVECTE
jgi:hypothetical protein